MAQQPLTPIKFCHISTTPHLNLTESNGAHLILAHLVESDPVYAQFYADLDDGKQKILDNSAFEMFKQNRPMYPSSKLVEMGHRVNADVIVMSDYPRQPAEETIKAARDLNKEFSDEGFGSFFVPQSTIGSTSDYLRAVEWAMMQPNIELIGLSILGCPIALGLDEKTGAVRGDAYKMQRFLSRWKIFKLLEREGLLHDDLAYKRFHCLGMVDGPNEIALLQEYSWYINSWDSSAAVWAGLNGISFDQSPTGLTDGKFEKEVDFDFITDDELKIQLAQTNISYINRLCRKGI